MSELKNYSILKYLGEGGYGKVKCNNNIVAKNIVTQQKVAIKYIKISLIKSKNLVKNLIREAKILRKFNHPYIVKL